MSDEARCSINGTDHPWCLDPARDEAVRAAEDGRPGPLPTLEEAIAAVTERRPPEPGGGGNVTPGLRTERVTLEVTHDSDDRHIKFRDWDEMLFGWKNGFRFPGESVRVVEESHFDDLAQVAMERDAAIRERDAHKEEYYTLRAERITQALTADRFAAAVQEADRLRASVAELESAPAASEWRMLKVGETVEAGDEMTGDMFLPWRDAGPCVGREVDRTRYAFRRRVTAPAASGNSSAILTSSPAASGAAGTEVVAWGIANPGNPIFGNQKVWAVRATEEIAKDVYRSCNGWVHFPLYAAPQPAKGWLTAEERKWVEYMSGNCVLPYAGMKCMEAILARSSPPEVVLPALPPYAWSNAAGPKCGWDDCMGIVRYALAAAGVTVKEVGK